MTTPEKVAYLKGLMEGLGLDNDKKETKMFKAITDILDDLALDVDDLNNNLEILNDQVDAIDEDLDTVESILYDDEDDECDCCCDDDGYEVECPVCGEEIYLDDEMAEEGSIECPNCGELLEFDLCDCGCECDGEEAGEDSKEEE